MLFKDKGGHVGLIADHCAHRGASLLYGRVEERGIACAYHGWLYDTSGNCLECPAEPAASMFHLTVKQRAYRAQKFMGLYWAYLGPEPAPAIPRYDVWVRKDGRRRLQVHPRIDCNWFQAMENSVDPAHLQILHQEVTGRGRTPPSSTRGFTDDIARLDFYVFPHGIIKKRGYKNGVVDEHPLLFPTVLRVNNSTEIRVPVDWHASDFQEDQAVKSQVLILLLPITVAERSGRQQRPVTLSLQTVHEPALPEADRVWGNKPPAFTLPFRPVRRLYNCG